MLDPRHIRAISGHQLWQGPALVDGHTPAQHALGVFDRPVFNSCGFRSCINPDHLHVSIIAARLGETA